MKYPVILLSISTAFLMSCGGNSEEHAADHKTYDYEKADSISVEYVRELGNIRISIEETGKLFSNIKIADISFNSSLMNSGKSYSGSKKQALNLGVYSTDMSYASAYEQTKEIVTCLKSMMTASEQLGIKSAFDENMLEELTSNDTTTNKSTALTEAYLHAEDQMYSNERAQLATLMVIGGWVEGLYIALEAVNSKPSNDDINQGIWNHVFTYENCMKMLDAFKGNADCDAMTKEMLGLKAEVEAVVNKAGNANEKELGALSNKIKKIRNKITS